MTEEEQKFLSETRMTRRSKEKKSLQDMNRKLNYGIAIVSVLIVIVTAIILNNRDNAEVLEEAEPQQEELQPSEAPVEEPEPAEETLESDENVVSQSADANVIEVWTNASWQPYPKAQTGTHTSVFEAGHIDYEEKLAAAFSVLPIEQADSIVTSARNNGDAKSARIVISNKDGNYRVIINWVEQQGWLPTTVDVLHSTDGVR